MTRALSQQPGLIRFRDRARRRRAPFVYRDGVAHIERAAIKFLSAGRVVGMDIAKEHVGVAFEWPINAEDQSAAAFIIEPPLTTKQASDVRAIVAEMIGQFAQGATDRIRRMDELVGIDLSLTDASLDRPGGQSPQPDCRERATSAMRDIILEDQAQLGGPDVH